MLVDKSIDISLRIVHFNLGHTNPESANGVDKTVFYLSKHLALSGHHVTVCDLIRKHKNKTAFSQFDCGYKRFPIFRLRFLLHPRLIQFLFENRKNIDVVHLHSVFIPEMALIAFLLRRFHIPYVVTPNGGYSEHALQQGHVLQKRLYKLVIEKPFLDKAVFIHAVSESELKAFEKYGVSSPYIYVPNGIELETIPTNLEVDYLERLIPEVRGRIKFLFCGRLDPLHKGLDILIQGFAKATERLPGGRLALVIVGPDKQGSLRNLQELASSLHCDGTVFFTGGLYGLDKWNALASADFFVHTSRWEGMPFALIEALAMAKPCLVTPGTNMAGFISKYGAGLVVDTDSQSIAAGFVKLFEIGRVQIEKMCSGARRLVMEELQWSVIVKRVQEAYMRVIS